MLGKAYGLPNHIFDFIPQLQQLLHNQQVVDAEDMLVWSAEEDGILSVKAAKNFLQLLGKHKHGLQR